MPRGFYIAARQAKWRAYCRGSLATIESMRRPIRLVRHALTLIAATALIARAGAQSTTDRRPFRSGIELTSVTATVRDADGRLVKDLGRDAFEMFEDGEPQT